ncbi:hypothetical protein WG947_08890 [Pontibacter sp. H259]|uniref:hypothetical protein n=1 Tax=Pontibacter sp. H259 TaxID=3133421 RepID=UPI0030BD23DC
MTNERELQGELAENAATYTLNIFNYVFGVIAFAIGTVNTFWGNDPYFGIFIILLSFIYLLPVNDILYTIAGFQLPKLRVVKVLLGVFIIWAAVGVGELADKIELMLQDLQ